MFCSLLAALAVGGCDTSSGKADKRIDDFIAQAMPKMDGADEDLSSAQKLLDSAARETDASLPQKIRAKALLAQIELQTAERVQPKIDQTQSRIDQLIWEINSMASQVQEHNQVAAALSTYDPAQLQASLKKIVSDAQGSADQPVWVKSDVGTVPTLAAARSDADTLSTQIAQLQQKLKLLTDTRDKSQTETDALAQQSDLAKGDAAVALFKQAADARKQSDELSVEIDQTNGLLSRALADLAIKQGQQAVLNEAISDFTNQLSNADAGWAATQKLIADQLDQAKAILGDETEPAGADDPTGGATIAAKAATLAQLVQENRANRDAAEQNLNSAVEQFRTAAGFADQLQAQLTTKINSPGPADRPQVVAWKALIAALSPARYRLQEANTEIHRAALFAGQADSAASLGQLAATLKPILDVAKLSLPPTLADSDNKIADDLKNGREQADLAYKNADDLLSNIMQAPFVSEDHKKAAEVAEIFNQYGWYLLSSSVGDQQAADHLKAAQAQRDSLIQGGSTLNNLPPELAVAAAPAAGAAGGTPGTSSPPTPQ
jgi:myosin heavy subunit